MVHIIPWEMHDADALSKLVSEVSKVDLRNSRLVQNSEKSIDWIANLSALQFRGEYHFAIWDNDTLVGDAGVHMLGSPFDFSGVVSWVIADSFKSSRLLKEVIESSLQLLCNKVNVYTLISYARVNDRDLVSALNACGLEHTGTYKKAIFDGGKFCDLAVFECMNSEFGEKSDKFASRTASFSGDTI